MVCTDMPLLSTCMDTQVDKGRIGSDWGLMPKCAILENETKTRRVIENIVVLFFIIIR